MSLDDSRIQILLNFDEEKVEVNQRLLIDKILARYSSEFVVYRELMQNSDDAKSSSIQILFETENNKITRILFKNNGSPFSSEDWDRLKKIAEGNPDEQKIGAFGVGFYSLFSFCENPFVSSGGQGMAFYWRENQLFTKQGPIEDKDIGWTTFLMDMREPIELPVIEVFAQYLTNSLGFTANLREISVNFNDTSVIQLSKKMQDPKSMSITPEIKLFSPLKIFHLTSVDVRDIQLDVKCLTEEASLFFKIASGNLDVQVSDTFSANMERITKKKPPNETTIQMIFTGFDEHNSSVKNISPVFKDLLKYPEQGKIYIGFSTQQTTGCCSHLAARVIPTMERESIDLANKTLAEYNNEMLCIAGTLCRILYENEMTQITRLYDENIGAEDEEINKSIQKRAAHILTHFTFNPSTPNAQVGMMTESQFFDCLKQLSILSTNGVLPISDIRMPNSEMVGFIKNVPVVPKIILEQCDTFFVKAKDIMKLIKELTLQDVLYELESRVLSEDEMVHLLKWWISFRSKKNTVDESESKRFMQLARIDNGFAVLDTIRYFLNPGIIPPDVDIPVGVLPYTISRELKSQDLVKWFGWIELPLINWAKFIVNKPDLELDPTFATKVHQILAKNFKNTSKNDKKIIRQLFVNKRCIPTKFGMKIPSQAYFENVNLFSDLPTIQFQKPLSVRNIMEHLGVRKVVDLEIIFNHLNGQHGQEDFDHMQLVKYLGSMLSDLKPGEIKELKNKPIWPKENSTEMNTNTRFLARELYTPISLHREFGLPVIDWKGRWPHNTQEGKFLIQLGLQEYPTLDKILELAAPPTDPEIRNKALKYFIDNFEEKYSKNYNPAKVNVAFLPCSEPNIYAKPLECFINPECMIMKFRVIRQDLRFQVERFGVCQHPDYKKLSNRLIQDPPQDEDSAKKIFEYLASQQGINNWKSLSNYKFIPIKNGIQSNALCLTNPRSLFFRIQDETLKEFFSYVDFGEIANKFLQNCGVKYEPSTIDLAELLVKSSDKLWKSIGDDIDKYLNILRRIAIDFSTFGNIASKLNLVTEMKKAPILAAIKKEINSEKKEINRYYLASAREIFINDDKIYQKVFNPLTAPEEYRMEFFYKKLGCRSLHESVKETSIHKGKVRITEKSKRLQETIIERASLFYHDHPERLVKRDVEWLKRLNVREIDYIETTYRLETTEKIQQNDTSILQDEMMDSWTLYITSKSSPLGISQHIVKSIYKSNNWKDVSYPYMILNATLESLKELGYPVDRILQQPKLQHIIDQMMINQREGDENTLVLHNKPISHKLSHKLSHGKNTSKIFNSNVGRLNSHSVTITFESTQILRNSLQDAMRAYYSSPESTINGQKEATRNDTIRSIVNNKKGNTTLDSILNRTAANDQNHPINYCDIIPVYCVGTLQEIKLYVPEGFNQSEILSQTLTAPLNRFVDMLKDLADVFELSINDIHIFYDNKTNSIAFNRDRALFFNLRFYLGLHDEECKIKPTINVMTYWFMMFCHELAHNFILHHNPEHEYYFISLAEIYMSNFLAIVRKREIFW